MPTNKLLKALRHDVPANGQQDIGGKLSLLAIGKRHQHLLELLHASCRGQICRMLGDDYGIATQRQLLDSARQLLTWEMLPYNHHFLGEGAPRLNVG